MKMKNKPVRHTKVVVKDDTDHCPVCCSQCNDRAWVLNKWWKKGLHILGHITFWYYLFWFVVGMLVGAVDFMIGV